MMTKKKGNPKTSAAVRDLSVRKDSGVTVKGGSKAEAQVLEVLSSSVKSVLDGLGKSLSTAAQK